MTTATARNIGAPSTAHVTAPPQADDRNRDMLDRIRSRCEIRDAGYSTPCWISTRAQQGTGYTKIGSRGRTLLTHRAAYEAARGPIPDGLVIDHLCRNRACANPDHLEAVSTRTNLLRGEGFVGKQARRTHCPRGHELTPENIYRRPDGKNLRECMTCRRSWRQRHAATTP